MATLKELNSVNKSDKYKIMITSSFDTDTFIETYEVKNPETDKVTQLLFYAHKHYWNLIDKREHDFDLLMNKVYQFLSEDQILDLNYDLFKSNLHDFVDDLTSYIPLYIEFIKIEKDNKSYDLEVTDDDIYNIFKELAEI